MGLLIALAAAAGVAAGVNAQCVPLAEAASSAGLTAILDAVTAVAELEDALPLLAAATADEPVSDPITLFAPTNEAFEEISDVTATLSADIILAVLANHIVPVPLSAADILAAIAAESPAVAPTLLETTLEATTDGTSVFVTPTGTDITATVLVTDVETCAGIVHVVDKVLIPAFPEEEPEEVVVGEYGEAGAYGYGAY